jgi:Histidine phosphatase superfamily (branch 1)
MRILIVRHADPEYHGDTLTPHGWKEAEALAAALCRNKDVGAGKLTGLFTSPMGRARDTARCTEKVSGLVAEVQEWTRELTYWPRMELEWNGRPDAGRGPGKGGEGGLAVWDVPGETVRSVAGVTAANEFESVRPVASAKEPYAALCASSDAFLVALGYRREADGSYTIVRRNRDVRATAGERGGGCLQRDPPLSRPPRGGPCG